MFSYHLDFAQGNSLTLLLWPLQCGRGAGLAAATSWAGSWLGSLQTCLSYIKINSIERIFFFSICLICFIPTIDFSKLKTSKLLIRFSMKLMHYAYVIWMRINYRESLCTVALYIWTKVKVLASQNAPLPHADSTILQLLFTDFLEK